MDFRNAQWANAAGTMIDAEILHPEFGWIPITLSPDDQLTAEVYAQAAAGDVAPYVPPADAPPPSLTFLQMIIGMVTEEWITEAEGDGWLAGTLPAPVLAVIAGMPQEYRFAARARALRPSVIERDEALVEALAQYVEKTSAEVDTFFRTYAQV